MPTGHEQTRSLKGDELRRRAAAAMLEVRPGERMPTVRHLATRLGGSLGATQAVLARLEEEQAFSVERRGRSGSFLTDRSVGALWLASENAPLVIALPLPTTPRIHGLATAIKALLSDSGVDCFLVFIRGSRNRLAALRQGRCHVAVMSSLAAEERRARTEAVILELPRQTFVREHRVYYVPTGSETKGPTRVIIDRDSADFETLIRLEFGDTNAELVPATYMQFARLLHERRVDATILDADEVNGSLPDLVLDRPLSSGVSRALDGANTKAAFVARKQEAAVALVVRACLDPTAITEIQNGVLVGDRVPEY